MTASAAFLMRSDVVGVAAWEAKNDVGKRRTRSVNVSRRVTLALQELERKEFIDHRRGFITIIDREALQENSNGTYSPIQGEAQEWWSGQVAKRRSFIVGLNIDKTSGPDHVTAVVARCDQARGAGSVVAWTAFTNFSQTD